MTTITHPHLDLATLETMAHRHLDMSQSPSLDECGGWACERLGLHDACEALRRTPTIGYAATELVGLEHHHICWMLTLLSDPTISYYEPMPVSPSDPQAADILGQFMDRISVDRSSAQAWLVLEAGRRVGVCQLRRTGEGHLVGVSLQATARDRGLGTAVFKALSDWGLEDGGFVAGEVEDDNVLSHNALQSAGYAPEDRYALVLADGRPTMVTRYETR